MFINVWLKIITCSCTLLFEKRKFQFTNSIAFLMASWFDFLKFQLDTDREVDTQLWGLIYKMWFGGDN